jgi:hypothetical protein
MAADEYAFHSWFHVFQTVAPVFGLVLHACFLAVVARNRSLHVRHFLLLCTVSLSDVFFLSYVFVGIGVVPLARGQGLAEAGACGFGVWWIVFCLFLSLYTYALIALERWGAICDTGPRFVWTTHNGALGRLWVLCMVVSAGIATGLYPGLSEATPMPSGAYCLLRFSDPTVTTVMLVLAVVPLSVAFLLYGLIGYKLVNTCWECGHKRPTCGECPTCLVASPAEKFRLQRNHHKEKVARQLAFKLLALIGIYVVCWVPALVM